MRDKLIFSADSLNTAAIGDYIQKNGLPSEAEQDGAIYSTAYSILALHILRDSIGMSRCPGWHIFDSAYRANALAGKCSPKWYVFLLDQRHRLKCRASKLTETQRYGALKRPDLDPATQKQIYVFQFEIEDIEQVDERRAQWYLPTLLQESTIDPELVLPKNYSPR